MFALNPSSVKNPTIEKNKALYSNKTRTFVTPLTTSPSTIPLKKGSVIIQPAPNSDEYNVLVDLGDLDDDDTNSDDDQTIDSIHELPLLPQIYLGSLTILGLYIFYKLLHK
jgi:hypothetical protein